MSGFPKLAGVAEVAALAGVSRQRAHVLTRHPQFPKPVDVLAQGPVWREADVAAFIATKRKPGRRAAGEETAGGQTMIHGYRVDPITYDGDTDTDKQEEDLQWEAALDLARILSGTSDAAGGLAYERVEVREQEVGMVLATFMHGDRLVADYRTKGGR